MSSIEEVQNIPVSFRDGEPILLRNIAKITEGTTVGQYERYNMQRMITISANIGRRGFGNSRQAGH